jgi:hypothetical protein
VREAFDGQEDCGWAAWVGVVVCSRRVWLWDDRLRRVICSTGSRVISSGLFQIVTMKKDNQNDRQRDFASFTRDIV